MNHIYHSLFISLLIVYATSCVKDKPNPAKTEYTFRDARKAYLILEGNYGGGNASMAVWYTDSAQLYNNVFASVNGSDMGDVFQSMCRVEDKVFLALNHSDEILVCDRYSMQLLSNISLESPRYFLPIHSGKAYVGSLNQPFIHVLDLINHTVEKKIDMPFVSIEEMVILGDKVYVCSWDTSCTYIYEMDPMLDEIVDSIFINGSAPQSINVDKLGHLWVSYGNIQKGKPYGIVCIDPNSKSILKQFPYELGMSELIKPTFNASRDTLYWISVDYSGSAGANGIFRMSIEGVNLPDLPFIAAAPFQYFYALEIDPLSQMIYVGDPKSFIESSTVSIYSTNGELVHQFDTGMGIGDFYFDD